MLVDIAIIVFPFEWMSNDGTMIKKAYSGEMEFASMDRPFNLTMLRGIGLL